jgi:hypothetical protein
MTSLFETLAQATKPEEKEVIMTDGNKCIVKQTDTLMAKKIAEICRDYTEESSLTENEVSIACYRIGIERLSKIEILGKVCKEIDSLELPRRAINSITRMIDQLKTENK